MSSRKRNSTTFKKGDPRARAAAKKSHAPTAARKPPEARELLRQLQDRTPDVLAIIDAKLKEGDDSMARVVLDRILPSVTVQRFIDEDVAKALDDLREENAELRKQLAERTPPAKAVGS